MHSESRAPQSWRAVFLLGAVVLVVFEFALFSRVGTTPFTILGSDTYTIQPVHDVELRIDHSFLMRGEGLNAVAIELNAGGVTDAKVDWILWRGHRDEKDRMTMAFKSTQTVRLHRGRQWVRLEVPRDTSSHDRWYTIELHLPGTGPADRTVGVMASSDNPARGGVLWVDDARQHGSLHLRVEREGRGLARRLETEIDPHLPSALANPFAQLAFVIVLHGALLATGIALIDDVWSAVRSQNKP